MLRRGLAAFLTLALGSLALAGSHVGVVTHVSKTEIVIKLRKDPSDKKSDFTEVKKLTIDKSTKFYVGPQKKGDEPKESSLEDATRTVSDSLESTRQKGTFAKVETTGEGDKEVVTRVILLGRGK